MTHKYIFESFSSVSMLTSWQIESSVGGTVASTAGQHENKLFSQSYQGEMHTCSCSILVNTF